MASPRPPPNINPAAAHGGDQPENPSQSPRETYDGPTDSASAHGGAQPQPVSASDDDEIISALQSYISDSSAAAPQPELVLRVMHVLEDPRDTGFVAGLLEEVVSRFMKTKASEKPAAAGDAEVCAVCLDDLRREGGTVGIPRCEHSFHGECIGKWLQKKNLCPLCKAIAIVIVD